MKKRYYDLTVGTRDKRGAKVSCNTFDDVMAGIEREEKNIDFENGYMSLFFPADCGLYEILKTINLPRRKKMKFYAQSPVPIALPCLSSVINQVEAQGWAFHSALHVGFLKKTALMVKNEQTVPAFIILISIDKQGDISTVEFPHIDAQW